MKVFVSAVMIVGLLAGCSKKSMPDPQGWFIESYDGGLITVQHEGNTYKDTCADPYITFECNQFISEEGGQSWAHAGIGRRSMHERWNPLLRRLFQVANDASRRKKEGWKILDEGFSDESETKGSPLPDVENKSPARADRNHAGSDCPPKRKILS